MYGKLSKHVICSGSISIKLFINQDYIKDIRNTQYKQQIKEIDSGLFLSR